MPSAVPRSASDALSAALLPYLLGFAGNNWQSKSQLQQAINIQAGQVAHPALKNVRK
ncbi:MAG: hypothetical protein OEY00_13130 [Gammaproteobacteria bacterium]|nr:hypothetical protein [Gammaproteobacteria bacterium]